MKFTKIQGLGNDFIIINNMENKFSINQFPILAKRLCKRRISLGADGFMVVDYPEGKADFKMRFYNSDGSIGEMCGNGARCIARYAYENKLVGNKMKIENASGIVLAEMLKDRLVNIQLSNPTTIKLNVQIEVDDSIYDCSYIELGEPGLPHLVVNYPELETIEEPVLRNIGRKLRYHKNFPKGANVNFVKVKDKSTAIVKTYERGVEDFTLACGTGSASTAVALLLSGQIDGTSVRILNPGGELFIEIDILDEKIDKLYLIGDTNIIAVGEILDEDIKQYIPLE